MPIFRNLLDLPKPAFVVGEDDFSALEIRDSGTGDGLHHFYDTAHNRLVKSFELADRPQVATYCDVTLIKKGDRFSPRLHLWKRDKTKAGQKRAFADEEVEATREVVVKASVNTDDCHESFWQLIDFITSFTGIDVPDDFRVASADDLELGHALRQHDKGTVLQAVKSYLDGAVTQEDVDLLLGRRQQLDYFKRLLEEDEFFDQEAASRSAGRPEGLWQKFFEENPWIFGYGLTLVSCDAYDKTKLERVTTGQNVFTGAGKRNDALMRTRGFASSLLFGEIKTHRTELLATSAYRPPDVYAVSPEITGGVAQVEKTTHKAVRDLHDLHQQYTDGGEFEFEVSTIRPRQVLLAGHLDQLKDGDRLNPEKLSSFELYRRGLASVEVLTFDELYERATFIVQDPPK
ncbi:MAG TPA: DUF4263 domain-containing protein [Microthrixaceae bacterium]|nr:DUF4263 domain-containing protein [Microthrixaceae bacterium]